jgi:exodeoxyribonuclease-3
VPTWYGVAILEKARATDVTRTALPGHPEDTQSRYIEVAVSGRMIDCPT